MSATVNKQPLSVEWVDRMERIDRQEWDALALPLPTPILEWEWLRLMEESGSIVPEAGWIPRHLVVRRGGRLVGAAPLYVKTHSAGEFVYDYMWAEVAGRLGVRYYPKLVGMSPVTPAVGYRFLVCPEEDEGALTGLMLEQIERFCRKNRLGGASFLFVDPSWRSQVEARGYSAWLHQSYLWQNPGFDTFEAYLSVFNKNQRRNIRRERQAMQAQGIRLRALADGEIRSSLLSRMYRYYERTNDKFGPWGCKYLTPEFFEAAGESFRHRLLLVAAYQEEAGQQPLALSMLLRKDDLLLGRYWGTARDLNALHFNACYYSPIEWAIHHGVRRFDPGAGSPHKVRRGFRAVSNHSLHRFWDPRLDAILRTYLGEINQLEQGQIDALNAALPFARSRSAGGAPGNP